MWYIHTVDYYYSGIKRNEVSVHTTTWMNPENIMLSERNQSYTHTHAKVLHGSIYMKVQNKDFCRDKVLMLGKEWGNSGVIAVRVQDFFLEDILCAQSNSLGLHEL